MTQLCGCHEDMMEWKVHIYLVLILVFDAAELSASPYSCFNPCASAPTAC